MKPHLLRRALLSLALTTSALHAQFPAPDGGTVRPGTLPAKWDTGGPKCMEMQEWQAHEYNPDFVILRQSGCTDYEKPFVYLLFGKEHALIYDTGSRNGNIVPEVKLIVHNWLLRNSRESINLYIVHSHSHGDHTAGDRDLQAMNDPSIPVTFVPATPEDNASFYKMKNWPEDLGGVDLGDRMIDALAVPGHDKAAIALYDRQTGVLLTGDNVYPGRLYISDLDAYTKSNERLIKFTEGKPIAHVLGTHIEQSATPFLDYPVTTIYQPNEHRLELTRGTLFEIRDGLAQMGATPHFIAFEEFTLEPRAPNPAAGGNRTPGMTRTPGTPRPVNPYTARQQAKKWDQNAPDPAPSSAPVPPKY